MSVKLVIIKVGIYGVAVCVFVCVCVCMRVCVFIDESDKLFTPLFTRLRVPVRTSDCNTPNQKQGEGLEGGSAGRS